jgi:hypothetical protein
LKERTFLVGAGKFVRQTLLNAYSYFTVFVFFTVTAEAVFGLQLRPPQKNIGIRRYTNGAPAILPARRFANFL